jgi:predicted MFS family arabinose efflux permease
MTSSAPIRALAPMLGGLMLSVGLGYWSVFLFTVLVSVMGLALLTVKVRDPRHEPVPETES